MSATAEALLKQATALPINERAELAHLLIASLNAEDKLHVVSEEELDQRLARFDLELENGTAVGFPAEEVMAELRAKYT